jgi:hypothetical protein
MSTGAGPLTLEDRVAIDELFAIYAWALDTGNVEIWESLFTEDALIEDPRGEFQGTANVREFLEDLRRNPTFPGRQHWIGQTVLEGDAQTCRAKSFAVVTALHRTGATNVHLVAWYDDVMVKAERGWIFQQRIVRPWDGDVLARFPEFAQA